MSQLLKLSEWGDPELATVKALYDRQPYIKFRLMIEDSFGSVCRFSHTPQPKQFKSISHDKLKREGVEPHPEVQYARLYSQHPANGWLYVPRALVDQICSDLYAMLRGARAEMLAAI